MITDRYNVWAQEAIDAQVANTGEDIEGEIFFTLAPDPQTRRVGPALVLLITMPGPQIGHRGFSMAMVSGTELDEDIIKSEFNRMISQALEARSEALATGQGVERPLKPAGGSGLVGLDGQPL